MSSTKSIIITPAETKDAKSIFNMIRYSFDNNYLKFSIYQSEKSFLFLREQISSGNLRSKSHFFVLKYEDKIKGFYNALIKENEYFLNYIAIDQSLRGMKFGSLLLRHFEEIGRSLHFDKLGLEVFRSNILAFRWYESNGYKAVSSRYFLRLDLKNLIEPGGTEIFINKKELEKAEQAEIKKGFSVINLRFKGKYLKMSLIGYDICRLLDVEEHEITELVRSISNRFGKLRKWLIISLSKLQCELPKPESLEESVYMQKYL